MKAHTNRQKYLVIGALGSSQTLAWASSYYLIAILADAMALDTNSSTTMVFAAFSAALLLSALLGPKMGKTIDRIGGRGVLVASNLTFAAGLLLLASAETTLSLWLGWGVMGAAMGFGLYDAAFATLGRLYGTSARSAITGITLIAGFASTIGWPLTAWGEAELGWRMTCVAWAIGHLLFALPLNFFCLPKFIVNKEIAEENEAPHIVLDRTMWLLGFAFAAGWVISTGMAAHLPRLLEAAGATSAQAVAAGALMGPAQVAARLLEAGYLKRFHPIISARIAAITHPIGAFLLITAAGLGGGGWLALPFALLHGTGNGILTIAKGTLPLALYGPKNYGYRIGLLGMPSRLAQVGAPLAFGWLISHYGSGALLVSGGLALLAFSAFILVRVPSGSGTEELSVTTG
ncbi:MFS transporter [Kiloniella laminariae]|uniref:MFS transporter n=1 Tax=Kiloniella laminariae TaxID=454162 RepID=A0ABT4LH44_9PROT|nr:MFS transporter [Kiloniella laminariae]MCZ4280423.1 MFS transporter [Kiloniella laminariae]